MNVTSDYTALPPPSSDNANQLMWSGWNVQKSLTQVSATGSGYAHGDVTSVPCFQAGLPGGFESAPYGGAPPYEVFAPVGNDDWLIQNFPLVMVTLFVGVYDYGSVQRAEACKVPPKIDTYPAQITYEADLGGAPVVNRANEQLLWTIQGGAVVIQPGDGTWGEYPAPGAVPGFTFSFQGFWHVLYFQASIVATGLLSLPTDVIPVTPPPPPPHPATSVPPLPTCTSGPKGTEDPPGTGTAAVPSTVILGDHRQGAVPLKRRPPGRRGYGGS